MQPTPHISREGVSDGKLKSIHNSAFATDNSSGGVSDGKLKSIHNVTQVVRRTPKGVSDGKLKSIHNDVARRQRGKQVFPMGN